MTARISKEDYAALSESYELEPARRDEMVGEPLLRMGRPAAGSARRGPSPTRTVRLATDLDGRLAAYAEREHVKPSEIVRRALDDYLGRVGA